MGSTEIEPRVYSFQDIMHGVPLGHTMHVQVLRTEGKDENIKSRGFAWCVLRCFTFGYTKLTFSYSP